MPIRNLSNPAENTFSTLIDLVQTRWHKGFVKEIDNSTQKVGAQIFHSPDRRASSDIPPEKSFEPLLEATRPKASKKNITSATPIVSKWLSPRTKKTAKSVSLLTALFLASGWIYVHFNTANPSLLPPKPSLPPAHPLPGHHMFTNETLYCPLEDPKRGLKNMPLSNPSNLNLFNADAPNMFAPSFHQNTSSLNISRPLENRNIFFGPEPKPQICEANHSLTHANKQEDNQKPALNLILDDRNTPFGPEPKPQATNLPQKKRDDSQIPTNDDQSNLGNTIGKAITISLLGIGVFNQVRKKILGDRSSRHSSDMRTLSKALIRLTEPLTDAASKLATYIPTREAPPIVTGGPSAISGKEELSKLLGEDVYPQDISEKIIAINRNWIPLNEAGFNSEQDLLEALPFITYADFRNLGFLDNWSPDDIFRAVKTCQKACIVHITSETITELPELPNCQKLYCGGCIALQTLPALSRIRVIDFRNCPNLQITENHLIALLLRTRLLYCDKTLCTKYCDDTAFDKNSKRVGDSELAYTLEDRNKRDLLTVLDEKYVLIANDRKGFKGIATYEEELRQTPLMILERFTEYWSDNKKMPTINVFNSAGENIDAKTFENERHTHTLQAQFISDIVAHLIKYKADGPTLQGLGSKEENGVLQFYFLSKLSHPTQIEGFKALGIIFALCYGKRLSSFDDKNFAIGHVLPFDFFKAIHSLSEEDLNQITRNENKSVHIPEDLQWKILQMLGGTLVVKGILQNNPEYIEALIERDQDPENQGDEIKEAGVSQQVRPFLIFDGKGEGKEATSRQSLAIKAYLKQLKDEDQVTPIALLAKEMNSALKEMSGNQDAWQELRSKSPQEVMRKIQGNLTLKTVLGHFALHTVPDQLENSELYKERFNIHIKNWLDDKCQKDSAYLERFMRCLTGTTTLTGIFPKFFISPILNQDDIPLVSSCRMSMTIPDYLTQQAFDEGMNLLMQHTTGLDTTGYDLPDDAGEQLGNSLINMRRARNSASTQNVTFQEMGKQLPPLVEVSINLQQISFPQNIAESARGGWDFTYVIAFIDRLLQDQAIWKQGREMEVILHFLSGIHVDYLYLDKKSKQKKKLLSTEEKYLNNCRNLFTPERVDLLSQKMALLLSQSSLPDSMLPDGYPGMYLKGMQRWPSAGAQVRTEKFMELNRKLKANPFTPKLRKELTLALHQTSYLMLGEGAAWDLDAFGEFVANLIEINAVWQMPKWIDRHKKNVYGRLEEWQEWEEFSENRFICHFFLKLLKDTTAAESLRTKLKEVLTYERYSTLLQRIKDLECPFSTDRRQHSTKVSRLYDQCYQAYENTFKHLVPSVDGEPPPPSPQETTLVTT